jgi:hypothetical protein
MDKDNAVPIVIGVAAGIALLASLVAAKKQEYSANLSSITVEEVV